jgi:hypothetical protein
MTRKKDEGVRLPASVREDEYPAGDGPLWISEALGVPGCLADVSRFLSDDGEETALVLHFTNGKMQVFRPARLVTTRRLPETLGALGFPVPYYQPPQLALLGQAIGRVADRALVQDQQRSWESRVSFLASWAMDCLHSRPSYLLRGRAGVDVRAAIEYVRGGFVRESALVPLIVEPDRKVLLAWTVAVTAAIRDRFGTVSDGDLGVNLRLAELTHERLAARPGAAERGTHELPVWALYNGWQGVEVKMPDEQRESGAVSLCPL